MQPRFVLSLHLHEGNAERLAFAYWRKATGLPEAPFTKTFIEPAGTGHRKNHLKHGICRVRLRNPSDHWNRTMFGSRSSATASDQMCAPPDNIPAGR